MHSKKQRQLLHLMDCLGLETLTLIDVGVRWGIDRKWHGLNDHLRVIGFEPDPKECRRLNESVDAKTTFYPVALSDQVGKETLRITREPGRSSLYRPFSNLLRRYPDHEAFEILDTLEVPVNTLDNCLRENNILFADFVKLDVQGSEKKIIEGGADSFKNLVFGLEAEVEFLSLYEGQPLFSDVDSLCRKLGFTLFDLKPCYWKRLNKPINGIGQLVCADVLYLKDYIHSGIVPDHRMAGVAIVLCLIYQKYDFGLELLEYFGEQKVYSHREYESAKKILLRLARLRFPLSLKFKGRYRVANWLDHFSQRLKTLYWARWDDWKI